MSNLRFLDGVLGVGSYKKNTTYILDICSYLRYESTSSEYYQRDNNCKIYAGLRDINHHISIVRGGDFNGN